MEHNHPIGPRFIDFCPCIGAICYHGECSIIPVGNILFVFPNGQRNSVLFMHRI